MTKADKQKLSEQPNFSRKKLEGLIEVIKKNDTLYEVMTLIMDLNIRRPMIKYVANNLKGELVGAEIGTFEGENAKNMLKHLSIKHLYLIDPYISYSEFSHKSGENIPKAYNLAQKRVKRFNEKISFLRKKSEEAIDDISKDLDFVYIDGNHAYEYAKKDIEMYYPKVKKGGVIGGHDVWNQDVYRAVKEFSEKKNLKPIIKYPDFWFVKP